MVSKRATKSKQRKRRGSARINKKKEDNTSYFGSGISDGAIRRLARKGGVKRIASTVYQEMRETYLQFLEVLVNHAVAYCDCANRKTILPIDVVYSLKRQGRNIYGYVYDDNVMGHNAVVHHDD